MIITLKPNYDIFGLPPECSTYVSGSVIKHSMPIVEIIPCKPKQNTGMTLFTVTEDWERYTDILKNLGYELVNNSSPIKLAFIADSFPTDTFTNEYGESFLQKATDIGSQAFSQLAQMTNAGNVTETIKGLAEQLGSI